MIKINQRERLRLLVVLLILTTAACFLALLRIEEQKNKKKQAENEANIIQLTQIFESRSCQVPCWQGLIPGQSNLSDYQRFARTANNQGYHFRDEVSGSDGAKYYTWVHTNSGLTVFIKMVEGKLVSIEFATSITESAETIISTFGSPSHYSLDLVTVIETFGRLYLYYENIGTYITFSENVNDIENCTIKLSAPLTLTRVYFTNSNNNYEMVKSVRGNEIANELFIREWDGSNNVLRVDSCINPKK